MNFRVRVNLENPTGYPEAVDIQKGVLFEVIDPMSGVQNMMVDRDYQVKLGPYERKTVEVECRCVNSRFAPPSNTSLRATPFVVSALY